MGLSGSEGGGAGQLGKISASTCPSRRTTTIRDGPTVNVSSAVTMIWSGNVGELEGMYANPSMCCGTYPPKYPMVRVPWNCPVSVNKKSLVGCVTSLKANKPSDSM